MYSLLRKALFALPPETSHEISLDLLGVAERLRILPWGTRSLPDLPVEVMGLRFPNPVGLAAGLDKNGDYFNALGALGFGFVEIGTVTPRPQPGNPRPRLFRLPEGEAIINRMGFNNLGVDHLVDRVKRRRYGGVLGINIGKNADTPVERAVEDYLACLGKVHPHADYITVNISSPNTPGLRTLQFGDSLARLLSPLVAARDRLDSAGGRRVPLAVKIAPDMDEEEIRATARVLVEQGVDGVIATNTTLSRAGVEHLPLAAQAGGLSGAPLRDRSTAVIGTLADELAGRLPIIGVGGICAGEDAAAKIRAGASLVQVYTGFIYRGPGLVGDAVAAIAAGN
ncbi:MAG: quinone-dependent dihydroorotate dehydrogenase [Porticoccaceae bacterium]|jgi:dihydroorotate dehydrogenase|nr:quinone-dependent dihydroorotate dehydrogenase [Porticoccaceae bacterium]